MILKYNHLKQARTYTIHNIFEKKIIFSVSKCLGEIFYQNGFEIKKL